ncbi:Holliday junction branch migration protein RuvA [Candidatus Sumerlaeota bacterium]|nr:Holliday junction branch migration protein RuvA [Candidatus Sumerlaeota bacterium]
MIDSLHGTLLAGDADFAIIDVNGIRFRAEIPASTARELPPPGNTVTILTRLNLNPNEGNFQLFGFATPVERDCFDILTGISGIGPRKGLLLLSQIEIAPFANAIISNDVKYLSRIKGVGQKTAERLIVELREKMVPYSAPAEKSASSAPASGHVRDAIDALIVLGVRQHIAEKAIESAVRELGKDAPTQELIKAGLRNR